MSGTISRTPRTSRTRSKDLPFSIFFCRSNRCAWDARNLVFDAGFLSNFEMASMISLSQPRATRAALPVCSAISLYSRGGIAEAQVFEFHLICQIPRRLASGAKISRVPGRSGGALHPGKRPGYAYCAGGRQLIRTTRTSLSIARKVLRKVSMESSRCDHARRFRFPPAALSHRGARHAKPWQLGQLGYSLYQANHAVTEIAPQIIACDSRVFDRVMQQAGRHYFGRHGILARMAATASKWLIYVRLKHASGRCELFGHPIGALD